MKEESNSFPISDIAPQQAIEDLTMMLLYLSKFSEPDRFSERNDYYAWKGYPFGMLNKLDEKDYIHQGSHPSKKEKIYLADLLSQSKGYWELGIGNLPRMRRGQEISGEQKGEPALLLGLSGAGQIL